MHQKLRGSLLVVTLVTAAAVAPELALAQATPIATTDVVEQIGEINTAVAAVGAALAAAAAIAVGFKWLKGAIFG